MFAEQSGRSAFSARLRNLHMLGRMALRHAQDDPARLAIQSARRLPGSMRIRLARLLTAIGGGPGSTAGALASFLGDRPAEARRALEAQIALGDLSRIGAEVAVQVGLNPGEQAPTTVRARAAWRRGDLSGALTQLAGDRSRATRRLHDRLASERRTMSAGFRVPVPSRRSSSPTVDGPRALHLLTNSLPRTQSGYALRSHAILRSQQANGVPVHAVTRIGYPVNVGLYRAADVDLVEGVPYQRLLPRVLAPTPEGRLEQTVQFLAPVIERFRPTVLHTTTHFPNALVAQAAAEAAGAPWVYEVRGQLEKTWLAARAENERAAAARSERYELARAKETEMALAADHVVVLSEALRADLMQRGVPAERLTLVPNGVDESLLSDTTLPADARRQVGLPEDGFWVGTVSSLVDYEGLDVLVDAVALLRQRGLDVRCAIVGDGVSRPSLIERVKRLCLADHIVLPGRVPRAIAPTWHRALDVFVVPRRDVDVCRTVTPLKPIEAMAIGRPVVASDLPALAEIVEAPGTGLLFGAEDSAALADTLCALHEDPSARLKLGSNGRAFAATRTWAALGARYRRIYEDSGK